MRPCMRPSIVICVILAIAPSVLAQDQVTIPTYRNVENGATVYGDILSHSKDRPFGDAHGRSTNAHETAHGIASQLRMAHARAYPGKKINGFYFRDGKGVIVIEPRLRLRDVAKRIPPCLRSYRYNLYFVTQLRDWDDQPTYCLDEWVAYTLGGECAVDDYQRTAANDGTDAVSGCLDFSLYTIALCIAIEEVDPQYLKDHPRFLDFIDAYLTRAHTAYMAGRDVFRHPGQVKLHASLKNDPGAQPIREYLRKHFRGLFVDR